MRYIVRFLVGLVVVGVGGTVLVAGPSFILELLLPENVFVLGSSCKEYSHSSYNQCLSYVKNDGAHFYLRFAWTCIFYIGIVLSVLVGWFMYSVGEYILEPKNASSGSGSKK